MGIYVWGTGCGASELMAQGFQKESVTAFVDSFPSGGCFLGKPVLLPERTLYLFDSFAGFDPSAGAGEAMQAAHASTTVRRGLDALPYPERAVVKPGFFPDSLDGLEERFCLVSLDVDYEAATLEGLRYFWPRLSPGGYLLLHDWGNPGLPGPAKALEQFREEQGCRISLPHCAVLPK